MVLPLWLIGLLEFLQNALSGPLGGFIGGALSFFLLEIRAKRNRTRHDIGEAIAAELSNNYDTIQTHLKHDDRTNIPEYFRTSRVVFDAVASRLGELPFKDVLRITKLYGFLDEYNRMPAVWNRRARAAHSLQPPQAAYAEFHELEEGAEEFHRVLAGLASDCKNLAVHLRAAHVLGWRGVLPYGTRLQRLTRGTTTSA